MIVCDSDEHEEILDTFQWKAYLEARSYWLIWTALMDPTYWPDLLASPEWVE